MSRALGPDEWLGLLDPPDYGQDMSRRMAAIFLSARQSAHISEQLEKFRDAHRSRMLKHCAQMGVPKEADARAACSQILHASIF